MESALPVNLRRFRRLNKQTQSEVAEKAGISRNAYRNIETGGSKPRTPTLYSIAKVLGVPALDLLVDIPAISNMRFRTSRTLTGWERAEREQIALEVARWLLDYNETEKITGDRRPFEFAGIDFDRKDPISAAYRARAVMVLEDEDYIGDFSRLLENAGIKLLLLSSRLKGFNGLSVGSSIGGPAIAVNAGEWIPVEEQIFAAARELAHILMHPASYDSGIIKENDDEKMEADTFANYFLMPKSHFDIKWNSSRGSHWVDSVLHIKRLFNVSYRTVLDRLVAEGTADKNIYGLFVRSYNERFGRRLILREKSGTYMTRSEEPASLDRTDFIEDRLARLVMEALDRELISMSRAAEILNITVSEVRRRVQEWDSFNCDG